MSLIEALNWRYATKKMNGESVPQDKVDQIISAARLAPTSSGLQPFRIFVITDAELKEKLKDVAFGQQQITDASHVLVFAAWDKYTEDRVKGVFSYANAERGVPDSATEAYVNGLLGTFSKMTTDEQFHHAAKQAYIGFGVALAEAALLKVDATPMEGFEAAKVDELLGLKELGLRSTTILPLGYRDETGDWLVNLKKVRTPLQDFVTELN